jgi:hypothetical protein
MRGYGKCPAERDLTEAHKRWLQSDRSGRGEVYLRRTDRASMAKSARTRRSMEQFDSARSSSVLNEMNTLAILAVLTHTAASVIGRLTTNVQRQLNPPVHRPRSTPPKKQEHQWAITPIRQRGKFLGYVKAPVAKSASEQAIKYFDIKDLEQQRRLVAQRQE